MSFVRPYSYESEPPDSRNSHNFAFIALGLMGSFQFQWDHGNHDKNERKHGVTAPEIEVAVKDQYGFLALVKQRPHENMTEEQDWRFPYEERFLLFARRENNKILLVVFTLRMIGAELAIRPISAHFVKESEMHRRLAANNQTGKSFW